VSVPTISKLMKVGIRGVTLGTVAYMLLYEMRTSGCGLFRRCRLPAIAAIKAQEQIDWARECCVLTCLAFFIQ
jgi:hypothetical protein